MKSIESAPLVKQLHTCVVAVTCAYTHKVNNSHLCSDKKVKTCSAAQKATIFNSENWNRMKRKLNQKESQAFVSVQ